ncbi:MAG: hypothetical protein KGM44_12805 [bacterium]|nr:hypothetical protein [bacterium]
MHIDRIRTAGAFVVCLALVVLGIRVAADPLAPVVVVYPFQPNGTVPQNMGQQIAAILVQQIGQGGDVAVKPAPATSTPQTFQRDAQDLGAQYYVTGYVTPIGNAVSLVEYVVSVRTGTVIYSATATAANVTDVESQAFQLKKAILALAHPPETAEATPASAAPASAAPASAPAPQRVAAAESPTNRRWVVVEMAGGLSETERTQAQQALVAALKERGIDAVADDDPAPQGPSLTELLCARSGGTHLVAGTVRNIRGRRNFDGSIDAMLLDCSSGRTLRSVSGNGRSIAQAARATATALLATPRRRR